MRSSSILQRAPWQWRPQLEATSMRFHFEAHAGRSAIASESISSIHTRLRELTASGRQCLLSVPAILKLLSSDVQLSDVEYIFSRLLGFHEPLEQRIDVFVEAYPRLRFSCALDKRRRAALLRDDLQKLRRGDKPSFANPCRARPCQLPGLLSVSQLLGILYVTEGLSEDLARHGGALLASQRVHLDRCKSYFQPYGPSSHFMWNALLLRVCEELALGHADEDELSASAQQTYVQLASWIGMSEMPQP